MRIYILGISGKFMAGIAVLAKALGHTVEGCDQNIYPPMSTQLEKAHIPVHLTEDPSALSTKPDLVIVGNVIKRGHKIMEYVLNNQIPFQSGPEWLYENILKNRFVLAVSGTHGKTTTTSLLAWVLESAGLSPGFLIGGVAENFDLCARLGKSPYFVIEADEYDTAFFDKRPKFLHYHPKLLIINNVEFDHADIFKTLEDIKTQFHYLIRTVPENGKIIVSESDQNVADILTRGVWSSVEKVSSENSWHAKLLSETGDHFDVYHQNEKILTVQWPLIGKHNIENALVTIASATTIDINPKIIEKALAEFKSASRRLEFKGAVHDISIYDDFAHHPTAIKTTLEALRKKVGAARILAIIELGSFTMKSGKHEAILPQAWQEADLVFVKAPENLTWSTDGLIKNSGIPIVIDTQTDRLMAAIKEQAKPGDQIIVMSNTGFNQIGETLLKTL